MEYTESVLDRQLEKMTMQLTKKHEDSLKSMLQQCGFTEDYCFNHADEFHVIEHDNRKTYFHKSRPLFVEVTDCVPTTDYIGQLRVEYKVSFYKCSEERIFRHGRTEKTV